MTEDYVRKAITFGRHFRLMKAVDRFHVLERNISQLLPEGDFVTYDEAMVVIKDRMWVNEQIVSILKRLLYWVYDD